MKKGFNPVIIMLALLSLFGCGTKAGAFLVATDYVVADGVTDVTDALQKLIDDNPNRTIYFPDGVYLISRPLVTPALPAHSVFLSLANYAVIKAADNWEGDALVRIGGKDFYPGVIDNFIYDNGSNYGIEGGIFDGSNVANGIAVDAGREIRICKVSIKHTVIGLHVRKDPRYGSSDSDFSDINIVGNDTPQSIGVLVEGFDNTFTNMRIASINKGVVCLSGGNSFRNIHPLYIFHEGQDYESSIGFVIDSDNNFLNYCYSDQFAVGFKLSAGIRSNITDSFAWWYRGDVPFQTAIVCDGPLESLINGFHVGFSPECPKVNTIIGGEGGNGRLDVLKVR